MHDGGHALGDGRDGHVSDPQQLGAGDVSMPSFHAIHDPAVLQYE